jgi:hypothetical protein
LIATAVIAIAWLAFACLAARGSAARFFALSFPAMIYGLLRATARNPATEDACLCLLGLAGAWFGIAGIQLVARRSVSLNMLALFAAGLDPEPEVRKMFGARCAELERVGLVTNAGGILLLTPQGRRAARVLGLVYRLFDGRGR